jgi:hypothetical protein
MFSCAAQVAAQQAQFVNRFLQQVVVLEDAPCMVTSNVDRPMTRRDRRH